MGSLGATLPPEPEKSEAPKSEPKKEETPVEEDEPESEESDVELDLTGVILPDTGTYLTLRKFQDFFITQTLREINFGDSTSSKSAFFYAFRGPEFWFLWNYALSEGWNLPNL